MVTSYLLLLLPVAAVCGWYYGSRKSTTTAKRPNSSLPRDYFVGLNYLINEQPDKAVDVFIKLLEVDSDTVETHLALGSLFRRRGEVDRAIRIHQNIIARPQLAKQQRIYALAELAQDYLSAGVLDRAERLLLELIDLGENTASSLQNLLHIYQQQKDWEQAIVIAQKLEMVSRRSMRTMIAHFYCELAEQLRDKNQWQRADYYLKRATVTDSRCARASIIKADMYLKQSEFKSAIQHLQQVKQQDPDYISEVIGPLCHCYEQLKKEEELMTYLEECLADYPRVSVVLALADLYRKWQGDRSAIEFIASQIQEHPSLRGLAHLIELYLDNSYGDARSKLLILRELVADLLAAKPIYRCTHCGFPAKHLFWQCPKCRSWSTVKPIHGVEGD